MILVLKFFKIFFYQVLNLYLVAMYVSYLPKSKQKYFKILHIFKKIFQNCFGQGRSTVPIQARTVDHTVDRSSGNWGCAHCACSLSTGPCCGRPDGRLTVSRLASVCYGRSTGRSGRANGHNFE